MTEKQTTRPKKRPKSRVSRRTRCVGCGRIHQDPVDGRNCAALAVQAEHPQATRVAVLSLIGGPEPPTDERELLSILERADQAATATAAEAGIDETTDTTYPVRVTVLAAAVEQARLKTTAEALAELHRQYHGTSKHPPTMADLVTFTHGPKPLDNDLHRAETDEANRRLQAMFTTPAEWTVDKASSVRAYRARGAWTLRAEVGIQPWPRVSARTWFDASTDRTLAEVHADWSCSDKKARPPHPFGPFVKAWIAAGEPREAKPISSRALTVIAHHDEAAPLARVAAYTDRSLLRAQAVFLDGQPFASRTLDPGLLAGDGRSRRWRGDQSHLPFPRTIAGCDSGDILVRALAAQPLTGDERSPLRGDAHLLATLAHALTGPVEIPEAVGVLFFGRDTAANRARWRDATNVLRHLELTNPVTREWINLIECSRLPDGTVILGPPSWWRGHDRYRLTGSLLHRPWEDATRGAGGSDGAASGLLRTITGIEAWISYTGGTGKNRTASALCPVRPGGPGPELFIPWRGVLSLAGEPVPEDATGKSTWHQRYRRRMHALTERDYLAGGTVEIVRIQRGARSTEAGIWVRATDRYCAAHADRRFKDIPVDLVFKGSK